MARFRKGDRVIIDQGEFKGRWGVIIDKDVIGDELTLTLVGKDDDGRQIRTHEAHVSPVDD